VPEPSLYSTGWRQGLMFRYELALNGVVLATGRGPELRQGTHDHWVVTSQDCTLDQNGIDEAEPIIELRPVLSENSPTDWGIRSGRFLLTVGYFVDDHLPRTFIAPAALHHLAQLGTRQTSLEPTRALAFKTWLGLRYDRPAVPPERVDLARAIGEAVRSQRQGGAVVRDVLMQFGPGEPPEYALVAIVLEDSDKLVVRKWLADVALRVPADLGTASRLEAVTSKEASLHLLENSYAADVTQITWRRGGPQGAY
jgi:hypothetical protein